MTGAANTTKGESNVSSEIKAFYEGLAMGNAVSYQQAQNNIMLTISSALTDAIINGTDTERIKELMALLKDINSNANTQT